MRLSCRRRSVTDSEDVLNRIVEVREEDEDDFDLQALKEVQCKRRMAVVMD